MGFALLFIGLLMIIVGARGTYAQFGSQLASEFTGQNNFTYWIISITALGALGYIQPIQKLSRLLMTLVIIVLFLSHKGFFQQFQAALKSGPTPPQPLGGQAGTGAAPATGVTSGSTGAGSASTNTPEGEFFGNMLPTSLQWLKPYL